MKLIKKVFIFGVIILSQILLNAEAAPKCGGNPGGNDPACWTSQKETCKWTTIGTIYNCKKDHILCSDGYSNNNAWPCSGGRCDTHGGKGSKYGYFKKGNCSGLWCTNKPEPKPVVRYTCHYIDKYNNWTQCVNGVQIGKNPHWTTRSGTNCSNVSSTKSCPMATCIGSRPSGSHVCSGSDSGLSANTPWHKTDNCSTAGKCAYYYQCTGGNPPFGANWCAGDNTGLTSDVTWQQVSSCTSARKCEYTMAVGCGSANNGEYVSTADVKTAGTCPSGVTETNFVDNSGLPSGAGWTWNCTKANYVTSSCSAKKSGWCEISANGPFTSLDQACKYGSFHSVHLGSDGILKWTCGSGDTSSGVSYHIGSFDANDATVGLSVPHDGVPMTTSCFCQPSYEYSCADAGYTKDCSQHCGETNTHLRVPVKTDKACFPNQHLPVTEAEHPCPDQTIQCPPCGVNAGESSTINETN